MTVPERRLGVGEAAELARHDADVVERLRIVGVGGQRRRRRRPALRRVGRARRAWRPSWPLPTRTPAAGASRRRRRRPPPPCRPGAGTTCRARNAPPPSRGPPSGPRRADRRRCRGRSPPCRRWPSPPGAPACARASSVRPADASRSAGSAARNAAGRALGGVAGATAVVAPLSTGAASSQDTCRQAARRSSASPAWARSTASSTVPSRRSSGCVSRSASHVAST